MDPIDRNRDGTADATHAGAVRQRYYVHDNRPVRVTESHGTAPRAEYLNPDGTLTDADYWTVTVDGTETPEHMALDFWQRHEPDVV